MISVLRLRSQGDSMRHLSDNLSSLKTRGNSHSGTPHFFFWNQIFNSLDLRSPRSP